MASLLSSGPGTPLSLFERFLEGFGLSMDLSAVAEELRRPGIDIARMSAVAIIVRFAEEKGLSDAFTRFALHEKEKVELWTRYSPTKQKKLPRPQLYPDLDLLKEIIEHRTRTLCEEGPGPAEISPTDLALVLSTLMPLGFRAERVELVANAPTLATSIRRALTLARLCVSGFAPTPRGFIARQRAELARPVEEFSAFSRACQLLEESLEDELQFRRQCLDALSGIVPPEKLAGILEVSFLITEDDLDPPGQPFLLYRVANLWLSAPEIRPLLQGRSPSVFLEERGIRNPEPSRPLDL